jgi:signal transduction histidine kinase
VILPLGPVGGVPAAAALLDPSPRFEWTLSVGLMLFAAALAVGVAAALWRRRDSPGSKALTVLALGAGLWSLFYALELSSATLAGTLLFGRLSYLGIVVVPPAWFAFALVYTGRHDLVRPGRLVALSVPSLVMVGLVWTTLSTGLVWASHELTPVAGLSSVLSVTYGPVFWLWTAYAYLLTAAGTVLLVLSVAAARLFRAQTAALTVAVAAPWLGNLAFVSGVSPLDLTPVGFVASALALGSGFRRYSLLDVHPVTGGLARAELVERLPDAVLAVDARDRVVDLNPSAEAILDTTLDEAVGSPFASVAPALAALVDDADEVSTDFVVPETQRSYEVRASPLRTDRSAGRLITLRDVTERRRHEREVAVLNRVLRHDLRNDVVVIENYVSLLQRDPQNEEYLAGLARRAAEMRDLVETVREVERHLDADAPTRSTLDLARLVRERAAAVAREHPDATVETDLPADAWVRAIDLIGSAVDNLVENAVEHNDTDAPWVCVSVERTAVDGERYVDLTVADDGPPIPDADREVLVGRDPSLDDASGLGLWLVNWIVTDSGGTVTYEPNDPRGNVVTVRLDAPDGEQYGSTGSAETRASDWDASATRPSTDANGSHPHSSAPL